MINEQKPYSYTHLLHVHSCLVRLLQGRVQLHWLDQAGDGSGSGRQRDRWSLSAPGRRLRPLRRQPAVLQHLPSPGRGQPPGAAVSQLVPHPPGTVGHPRQALEH